MEQFLSQDGTINIWHSMYIVVEFRELSWFTNFIQEIMGSLLHGNRFSLSDTNLLGCKKDDLVQTDLVRTRTGPMEFEEFNKAASKQKVFKVGQMFVRRVLQLKRMAVDKTLMIVDSYLTRQMLIDTLQKSDGNAEPLLANIQFGDKK